MSDFSTYADWYYSDLEEQHRIADEITNWMDKTPSMKIAQVFMQIRQGELFDELASAITRYPKLEPDAAFREYILDFLIEEHEAWYALS